MRGRAAIVGLVAAAILASAATPSIKALPGARSVTIHIANFAFGPSQASVSVGDTILWLNDDDFEHVVVADSQAWSSPTLAHGRRFVFVASHAGRFPYHCSAHPVMRGMLEVKE